MVGHWLIWPAKLTEENIFSGLKKSEKKLNHQPQVIIIHGGGRCKVGLELPVDYQQQDLFSSSLECLRYGARLAKNPIYLSW